MKLSILLIFFAIVSSHAQVGINTTSPTATLDVNGNLRVRNIQEETNTEIAADSILLIDRNGIINRVSSQNVHNSYIKSLVKGSLSSTANLGSVNSSGVTIPYDEEIDINDEYDNSTRLFTAKQDGYYQVYAQLETSGLLSIASDFGIRIMKNTTVIAQQSFANVGVDLTLITVKVTPPVRNVQTIVQLNAGDTLSFEAVGSGLTVSLLGSTADCFFTIQQIR